MKCSIPEISWHNREPVLSVDIQPVNPTNNDFYRLATGGSDNLVLIWKLIIREDGKVDVTALSELTRHQRSVNVVKWSSNGEFLASGDDDSNIILWQLKTDNVPSLDDYENEFEERWNVYKVLRGHKEDVYDICWSPKCDKLLSGSVDNTAILWDVVKGKSEHIITDHKGFVQGVAWDPKNQYLATLSSDRVCRVFSENGRRVKARIGRGTLPVPETDELYEKEIKYFHDDTFKSYFRRLTFTPDGSLLLVPSGAVETSDRKNILFGTFAFTLDALNRPICVLPSSQQCAIVVKCCPILFELRKSGPKSIVDLPYRMIIAVATDSDVILYDTQQHAPCVHLHNIHYTRLTDLTWSPDGLLLAASSTDGYITLVTFKEGELGIQYAKEESDVEEGVLNISGCEELPQVESEPVQVVVEVPKVDDKPRKPSFLEQWAKQAPKTKRKCDEDDSVTETINKVKNDNDEDIGIQNNRLEIEDKQNDYENVTTAQVEVKKKRITPILISHEISSVSAAKTSLVLAPKVPAYSKQKLILTSSNSKVFPAVGKSSSTKKKKYTPSSINNTLLNYLKPLNAVKTSAEKIQKSEFKPQNLFAVGKELDIVQKSETDQVDKGEIKIKTNNLFKTKTAKTVETENASSIPEGEDTTEVPDDFVLAVEDSSECMAVEKENSDDQESKKFDKTIKRRISLITLSSPKNKKSI